MSEAVGTVASWPAQGRQDLGTCMLDLDGVVPAYYWYRRHIRLYGLRRSDRHIPANISKSDGKREDGARIVHGA